MTVIGWSFTPLIVMQRATGVNDDCHGNDAIMQLLVGMFVLRCAVAVA